MAVTDEPISAQEVEDAALGLAGTELASATCGSIRLKLFKIGALVTPQRATRPDRHGLELPRRRRLPHRPRPIMRLIRNRPAPPFNATNQHTQTARKAPGRSRTGSRRSTRTPA